MKTSLLSPEALWKSVTNDPDPKRVNWGPTDVVEVDTGRPVVVYSSLCLAGVIVWHVWQVLSQYWSHEWLSNECASESILGHRATEGLECWAGAPSGGTGGMAWGRGCWACLGAPQRRASREAAAERGLPGPLAGKGRPLSSGDPGGTQVIWNQETAMEVWMFMSLRLKSGFLVIQKIKG